MTLLVIMTKGLWAVNALISIEGKQPAGQSRYNARQKSRPLGVRAQDGPAPVQRDRQQQQRSLDQEQHRREGDEIGAPQQIPPLRLSASA